MVACVWEVKIITNIQSKHLDWGIRGDKSIFSSPPATVAEANLSNNKGIRRGNNASEDRGDGKMLSLSPWMHLPLRRRGEAGEAEHSRGQRR
jgi:hypothetical protein